VNDHLEMGLIPQSALGCLFPRPGDVFRIESDGRGGRWTGVPEMESALGQQARCAAELQAAFRGSLVKLVRNLVPVLLPPLCLLRFGHELGDLQIAHDGSAFVLR